MTLAQLFVAFGDTPVGRFMRDSTWAFATVEAIHLVGLAAIGGAVTLLGLAAGGLAPRGQPLAVTARGLLPVFVTSLGTMLATGALLVASKPYRYYLSDPFRAKMVFLVLAVLIYFALHNLAIRGGRRSRPIRLIGGIILITSWLMVGLGGRAIGLI